MKVADELDLQTYIVTSGENRCNPSTRADVVEAVIAAVYSDGGFGPAKTLVERLLESSMMAMKTPPVDPKTALQELVQGAHLPLPLYTVVGEEGPPHAPRFLIKVQVQGYGSVTSEGTSKRQAQREAARLMMEKLKK